MDIRWVRQEDSNGCGPATLAMLLGVTYRQARDVIDENRLGIDAKLVEWGTADSGCWEGDLDLALAKSGFFVQRRYSSWRLGLDPFAPVHYAMVKQPSNSYHFVVVLDDARVLDPMREGFFSLADWSEVPQLVGIARPERR